MNSRTRIWFGATAALIGATCLSAPTAWAASLGHNQGGTITVDFSTNPMTTLNPPVGPPLTIPFTCPFGYNAVFAVTGNSQFHETFSPSGGGWGGDTANGAAVLTDGSNQWVGQATGWSGGGSNATGQGEEGETFHFHGTSTSDGSSLDVKISYHATLNDAGTLTNFSENFTCS